MENRRKFIVHAGGLTIPIELEEVTTVDPVDPTDPGPTEPPEPPKPATGQAEKLGTCSFPWFPLQYLSDIGMKRVRCYCPVHWVYTPQGLFIEPLYQAWTEIAPGIDTYLRNAASKGIDVLLCLNQTPNWMRASDNGTGGNDFPPIKPGLSRTDPASYKDIAEFFFQIVARYGKTKHPDSVLRVDTRPQWENQPVNQKLSGLNLIKTVEIQNELDHWFSGFASEKYMKPEEHAALLSACYDACKRACPEVEVAMAGITDLNQWYLQAMYEAAKKIRPDKKFPCDIINVHHYSNKLNKPGTDKPTWEWSGGVPPEQDAAFSQINDIVAWARSLDKKCYVTEFGYDTKAPSMMHIKGQGMTDEQAQAEALVKSYRAYLAAGVDAVYLFNSNDDLGADDGGQFETSGMRGTQAKGYPEKPAYRAIERLIKELSAGEGQQEPLVQSFAHLAKQFRIPEFNPVAQAAYYARAEQEKTPGQC